MLGHEKNMWQNNEKWKFVGSSQQLLKCIWPVLIRDHRYVASTKLKIVWCYILNLPELHK